MKKICFLFCGGTITMKRNRDGVLSPYYGPGEVLSHIPQLKSLADISVVEISNIDSSNVNPALWERLAKTICEKYENFDGFVVTHGTDTMAYTASALSFALKNVNKSVIFTGAQKPLDQIPSDAVSNLINATITAVSYNLGIVILFGPNILRGNRATKVSESDLDAFDSPMAPPLGTISLEPVVSSRSAPVTPAKIRCLCEFDPNVIVVKLTPGLSVSFLDHLIDSDCHGVIIEAFGAGNIPTSLVPFLAEAKKRKLPVVVLSQCRRGITRMQLYAVGHHALAGGAIPGSDMTVEAATTKLMWLLAQSKDSNTIKKAFQTNLAGEVTIYGK
jgi:L-asparaginase